MANSKKINISWIDAVKSLALLGILLNHFVEEFGSGPWFTNPSENWPDFSTRMHNILPAGSFIRSFFTFFGWLGDNGPGVFIVISGITLTLSCLSKNKHNFNILEFYKKRLLRIFPLYLVIHILILFISLFIPDTNLNTGNPKIFLSLLGLRFTDGLFFYINPSWWFVWLILQLYCIYPFLFKLLNRYGVKKFLLIAVGVTIASRLSGILGLRYSESLSFWTTGIFCGTRLAEFAAGMVIGKYLWENKLNITALFSNKKIFIYSIIIYISGFLMSLTLYTTLLSNLFISVGLTGIFYIIFKAFIKIKFNFLCKVLVWVGIYSYGIYLFHQAPLIWTKYCFAGVSHYIAAIFIILLSFPVAKLIEKSIPVMQNNIIKLWKKSWIKTLILTIDIILLIVLIKVEPFINDPQKSKIFSLLLLITIIFQVFISYSKSIPLKRINYFFHWTIIIISAIQLFFLPFRAGQISVITGLLVFLLSILLNLFVRKRLIALILSVFIIYFSVYCVEKYLSVHKPLEIDKWGEFSALIQHPTRVYSLIPDKTTHLKYNNYDYILKTNSFGLASPEIPAERDSTVFLRILVIGDAFTMPEGLNYEQSYTYLLSQKLSEKFPDKTVQVINAGVTGYGPIEQCAQLAELCPLFKPDIVLYQFFVNEFEEASVNTNDRLRNIGFIKNNENLNKNKLIRLDQILKHYDRLCGKISEKLTGKAGKWRYNKSLLYFYEKGSNNIYDTNHIEKVRMYLNRMKGISETNGALFKLYFTPAQVAVSKPENISFFPWDQNLADTTKFDMNKPNRIFAAIVCDLDINYLDMTPYLCENEIQPLYYKESWHWNKNGHIVVSEIIYNDLIKNGL